MHNSLLHKFFLKSAGISIDSRSINRKELFFALSGEKFNGSDYCLEALEKGALYCIVDKVPKNVEASKYTLVDSVLEALQGLASFHRDYTGIPVVAITGSNGKTSSKELIAHLLESTYKVLYTKGNFNNHIGVPLTLLGIKPYHDIAVVEMGANSKGEIAFLSKLTKPNYGIITNIGYAHTAGFGSFEGVVAAKTELYQYISDTKGLVFVNEEDELLLGLTKGLDKFEYTIQDFELQATDGLFLKLIWREREINTKIYGSYNLLNISLAVAVANFFGVNKNVITKRLENFEFTDKRSELITFDRHTIALDAYNANLSSMREAIKGFLSCTTDKKKISILGTMNELGAISQSAHKEVIEMLYNTGVEAYFIGEPFLELALDYPDFHFFSDKQELIKMLQERVLNTPTFILIKGSRQMKLEGIVECLKT